MTIRTPEDWWFLVDEYWERLVGLVLRDYQDHGFLVVNDPNRPDYREDNKGLADDSVFRKPEDTYQPLKIPMSTDPLDTLFGAMVQAEMVTADPEDIPLAKDVPGILEKAKKEKDWQTIRTFLGRAWMAAPDHPSLHNRAAWNTLCDLCSEDHVFQTEESYEQRD